MTAPPNALCFGDGLPGSGIACRLELRAGGLEVRLPDRPPEHVPLSALSFDAGGFEGDQLVLRWAEGGARREVYVRDPALIAAIREGSPPIRREALERTARRVREARRSRRLPLVAAAVGLVGLLAGLWLGFDGLVAVAVDRIPIEWERAIGEVARREAMAGHTVIKEGPAVLAVQEITRRLVEALPSNPYQVEVTVVRHEAVNAFALPGGQIVVFTGLLVKAQGPEEVAGVLSHELSHVRLRHGLRRVVKTAGVVAVVTILAGPGEGLGRLVQRLGLELLALRFSREQETEADLAGLGLLHAAHIPPEGMIAFFDRLAEDEREGTEWLSTHPMSAARAARLREEAAGLERHGTVPFSFDWAAAIQTLTAAGAADRHPAQP